MTPPCVDSRYDADGRFHTRMQAGHMAGPFDLELRSVRVVAGEGRDRIVLTFAGEGTPGFLIRYVKEPIAEGSGEPIDLDGDTFLQLAIHGTPTTDPIAPLRRKLGGDVVDVDGGVAWEGVTVAHLGIEGGRTPFRVAVLTQPTRLVVELK